MSDTMVELDGGAKRSSKRPLYRLIPREPLEAMARRLEIGLKYGENNWQNGGPEFFQDAKNHAIHHLWLYLRGEVGDEQSVNANLDAALWNLMALSWWEDAGKKRWEERNK